MGNAASRATKRASKLSATNAARKYPPPSSNRTNAQAERPSPGAPAGPTVHPQTRISETRDQAINLDSSDPDLDLNARARTLGPVVAHPTLSHSSTFNQAHGQPHASNGMQGVFPSPTGSRGRPNPAVSLLAAREKLATEAEQEFSNAGRKGAPGRRFLDVLTLRQVLQMRDQGVGSAEIEERLGLRRGVVDRLGGKNVVGLTVVA